ncbi:glycine betaine ABC transporter substrate-binding protein [Shouchella lehensis]|uniref:Glycine/betaine ABC transporter n=1 Tax=Shouchella lehensis TaxID=300825 RepID=A0A4Y7WHJ9_9BACI|nr:glycine betaine ABC transporter substrate-binding protein [Shouchella lehensis]MBG9782678.1 glycine/betaine ABC transporter [Shouchella lehensis]TES47706.1 glycine/betaine ABC transporter [Shouchella lehensis]
MNWKHIGTTTSLALVVTLAACGNDDNGDGNTGSVEDEADMLSQEEIAENLTAITGIEPGAGIMTATDDAIEHYNLDLELDVSSSAVMTQQLANHIENHDPIVVTGWSPHWKFESFDLKYLDDPDNIYGDAENIHTIARLGLEEDMPEAHQILTNFFWTPEDMEAVMLEIEEGASPEEAARNWVDENQETVSEWTNGVEEVDGQSITLSLVNWDSEIASTNVIATVLTDMGFEANLMDMEAPYMWQSLATGDSDASVAAWLPLTHGHFIEDYEGDLEDLGENLEGTKIGLVVPEYMDIDSITDLPTNE